MDVLAPKAPKEATRVSWSDTLVEEAGVMQPPVKTAATPRSILVEVRSQSLCLRVT